MENITIGLWVSGGMLLLVILGMRVAFAAGLAGFIGLVWLRWNGFDYDPNRFLKALQISVKVAGLTPHSKVSAHVLSLIPVFILIGYLAYYAKLTSALFEAANDGLLGCPVAWQYQLFLQPLDLLQYQEPLLQQLLYLHELQFLRCSK